MTTRAILKGVFSPDLPEGEPSLPENPASCWVVLHADIGLPESEAADTFTFYVTTTAFLEGELDNQEFQLGRGLIILSEFSWSGVSAAVEDVIGRCIGNTWEEIASGLSKYAEYEND